MVYYPSMSRGPGTPIAGGRFPLIGFAHGHRLPWTWEDLLPGGRAGVDADAKDFSQDYRQWAGMLRYLASWGLIVVAPDLHWIIADDDPFAPGGADVSGRANALGAAMDDLRVTEPFAASIEVGEGGRVGTYGLLGHSQGGAAAWNYGRSADRVPPRAVGLISPNTDSFDARDRGGWAYPLLFIVGEAGLAGLDPLAGRTIDLFGELDGSKVLVQIRGGDHWGWTDSITDLGPPDVLADATLPEQQAAQRLLATHFVTMFLRESVLGEESISEDLEREQVLERIPGTNAEVRSRG